MKYKEQKFYLWYKFKHVEYASTLIKFKKKTEVRVVVTQQQKQWEYYKSIYVLHIYVCVYMYIHIYEMYICIHMCIYIYIFKVW